MQELNPKQLQINLTGFLEKNTSLFVKVQLPAQPCPFAARKLVHLDLHSYPYVPFFQSQCIILCH